jgi:hypothetical protein
MTATYVRLDQNNVVVELITLQPGVALADSFVPSLAATMVPIGNAVLGDIYDPGTKTFSAPVIPPPTPTELLNAKLDAGIQIVSTGTSALNGTYPITDGAISDLTGLLAGLAEGLGLPLGQSTVPLADTSGVPHNFTSNNIKDLASAIRDYKYSLQVVWNLAEASLPYTWPSLPITIP